MCPEPNSEPRLQERLLADMQAAMRSGDVPTREILRMMRSAVQYEEVERRAKLDDAAVVDVLQREVKKRHEAIELFRQGQRQDLVSKAELEIKIISQYLPAQLGADELESIVRATVQEIGASGPKQMGEVMKALMPKIKGRADGKLVSELVRRVLSGKD